MRSDPTARPGTLYLVPSPLDFGLPDAASQPLDELLPRSAIRVAARLGAWVCENPKTTRAFLKRVDAVIPLATPLQGLAMRELPRPAKGAPRASPPASSDPWDALLAPALAGTDLGLHSEAGLPAVADPGAALVAAAHRHGVPVVALPGASATVLALAASGLQGQNFAFVGYLPVDPAARTQRIRELEALARRADQTQLMIETPYRNPALLSALLAALRPDTRLAVSVGLATQAEFHRSDPVARWRQSPSALPADVPAVFAIGG
jgi:16S rRNA (cytidine1402-2'-O)-methyltransferase